MMAYMTSFPVISYPGHFVPGLFRTHSNPLSGFWRDAITRKIPDGPRRPCLSVREFGYLHNSCNLIFKGTFWPSLKTSAQRSWRRCDNKNGKTDKRTDGRTPERSPQKSSPGPRPEELMIREQYAKVSYIPSAYSYQGSSMRMHSKAEC